MHSPHAVTTRRVTVTNPLGLHLRAATEFVQLTRSFQSLILVKTGENRASGHSVLDLACLAAECGATLELEAVGPDAEQALDALADLVECGDKRNSDERVA